MAKVISEDTDLKSLLIEIIKKHDDLSLWVFDELTNPRDSVLGKLYIPTPNNLIDIINNYQVLHLKEISVTDDDSELIFLSRSWSPYTGFLCKDNLNPLNSGGL